MSKITETVWQLVQPVAEANGVELWDVEFVKEAGTQYLRVFIDKDGGVDINDCERVSRILSDALDEKDFIQDAYILEVSSPGLGRALKKDKHLEKSLGEDVEVKTYKPVDNCKEFSGVLKTYDENSITIEAEGRELVFAKADIAVIRLALDF